VQPGNNQDMKKLLKLLLVIFILGLVLGVSIVGWAVSEIPFSRIELIKTVDWKDSDKSVTILEAGSTTHPDLLKTYKLFSDNSERVDSILNRHYSDGNLVLLSPDRMLIHADIKLVSPVANHCRELYCFQHRMSFHEIPAILWNGLIGIEDSRFLEHRGVDPKSIARAIWHDVRERRFAQGGSTITQQLVKNLFLTNEKTISRKIKEMIMAIYIEMVYPKENIIEAYFNEVFWGAFEGIRVRGVHAAALFYFDKLPQHLDEFEATILISLLKGPYFYHPLRHLNRLKGRVSVVYENLVELGHYSMDAPLPWSEDQWLSWRDSLAKRSEKRLKRSMWKVMDLNQEGLSSYEQLSLVWATERLLVDLGTNAPGKDWAVKIFSQSVKEQDSFEFYSKHERNLRAAISSERHQIGSLLKPIVYIEALRLGQGKDEMLSTAPLTMKLLSGEWSPREVSRTLPETISVKESLQRSLNRPMIRIVQEVGFEQMEKNLLKWVPGLKLPLAEFPAQLLGAVELTMSELATMYAQIIADQCREKELEDGVLGWLSDPTQTTLRGVVDANLRGVRYFGKTGTSNEGWDTTFIAFDGDRITVIWVGHEGPREGENPIRLFGSTTAYRVYQNSIMWRGQRFEEFECPNGP
jgi:penicillin-binding protein 1B